MRPKRGPGPDQAGRPVGEADIGFNLRPWGARKDFEQGRDRWDFHSGCSEPMDRRRGVCANGLDVQVRGMKGGTVLRE